MEYLIRTMLVDSNMLEAEGIKTLMKKFAELVAHARNAEESLSYLSRAKPDVVLIDAERPNLEPSELTKTLKEHQKGVKVVWLAKDRTEDTEMKSLLAGADGCVPKEEASLLEKALKVAARGDLFFSRTTLAKYFRESLVLYPMSGKKTSLLTPREKEVLSFVQKGKTDKEIAEELFLSVETVKTHLKKVRRKLGLKRRRQIAYSDASPPASEKK